MSKIIILAFLAAILYSLASSFYFLVNDKGDGDRTVRRLTWRVGLSLLLVIGLYVSFKLGWIEPRGVDPVRYPATEAPGGD
nr:twin transmembrane helix small protein [Wenzhouxiangella sp. XN79A]